MTRSDLLAVAAGAVLVAAPAGGLLSDGLPARAPQRAVIEQRVWPEPPAPPRIRFLKTITPASTRRKPSLLKRIWGALSGGSPTPVMRQPYGISVGVRDQIYVVDSNEGLVHVFDPERSDYSTIDVHGQSLIGVAALASRLFVTDSDAGRLFCLDSRGRTVWTLDERAGLRRPTGIVAADDRVWVVDSWSHQVVAVSVEGQVLGHFGSQGREPGQFNYPTNIARGPDSRLYVTDTLNFRVQIFDATGRYLSSFGQLGDGSGDLNRPKGIAVDSDGHVYVVEGYHDVVQIFDDRGRFLLAFGEPGQGDGQLWLATGIAIHGDRIYVADSSNGRVQEFEYLKESR